MGVLFKSGRRNQSHHHYRPSYYHNQLPPPPPLYFYPSDPAYVNANYYCPAWNNSLNYANPIMGQGQGRPNYPVYYGNGYPQMPAPVNPPPYMEHQNAKVVKNDVHVHKDSIKLVVDEDNPDQHLVTFVFDAHFNGSITIYYFSKEQEESCKFSSEFPEIHTPLQIPFKKGFGQRFCQPSGTGVDLGFFELDALGKPSEDGVFPLVIFAEVSPSTQAIDYETGGSPSETSPRVQVTQAVIEKKSDSSFQVQVIRKILLIDGLCYEVRELFGVGNSSEKSFNDDDPGQACLICMTQPKDTAVMPRRHLCMCSNCAKELRLQTDKCPICRQPITVLIAIKINNTSQ